MRGIETVTDWFIDLGSVFNHSLTYGISVVVLTVVFLAAGWGKLRQPIHAAHAILDFGLARRLNLQIVRLLGLLEVCIGVWLLVDVYASSRPAIGALLVASGLLCAFSVLLLLTLLRGKRFPCQCFGHGDRNLSWFTFARTLMLAGVALLVLRAAWLGLAQDYSRLASMTIGGLLMTLVTVAPYVPRLRNWTKESFLVIGASHAASSRDVPIHADARYGPSRALV